MKLKKEFFQIEINLHQKINYKIIKGNPLNLNEVDNI